MERHRKYTKLCRGTRVGALALSLMALLPAAASAATEVKAFDSLATLRADRSLPSSGTESVSIGAARNEFESFQIGVRSTAGSTQGVRVELGQSLSNTEGQTIPDENVTFYREATHSLHTASDNEGGTGAFPDALIPERDYFFNEDRNAFPFDVASNSTMAAWIDVLVPVNQPAGVYQGTVKVSSSTGVIEEVPVAVTVHGIDLPSTSTLRSAFFINSWQICGAHTGAYNCGSGSDESWERLALYSRAALENRMTVPNAFPLDFDQAPDNPQEIQSFRTHVGQFLNGTSDVRLPGAELTTVSAYWQCVNSGSCLSNWKALAEQDGFADRFFAYSCDEPFAGNSSWQDCRNTSAAAKATWPGLQRLITSSIDDIRDGGTGADPNAGVKATDIVVPLINQMANRPGTAHAGNQRPEYQSFLNEAPAGAGQNEAWMYTSCMSFSCDESEDPQGSDSQWSGWPGYAIDQPAAQARGMGWMAYGYQTTGELYWNLTFRLEQAWDNVYYSGGNGDGNMMYPGKASAIGGSHDIPLESIRMKRIRDGREDYEYLHLLEQQQGRAVAMQTFKGLYGPLSIAAYNSTVSGAELAEARTELATAITGTEPPVDQLDTEITKGPKTRVKKARFRFNSSSPEATFECRINNRAWYACKDPNKIRAASGRHLFQVRAVVDGVRDESPAKSKFRIRR